MWGNLAGKVYARHRSFQSIPELIVAIREAWASITPDHIFTMYHSIPRRLLVAIDGKGDAKKSETD